MRVTIKGEKLMTFSAVPRSREGGTFNRLSIPELRYYAFTTLSGLAQVRVRARYRKGRVHIATFLADVSPAPAAARDSP